MRDDGRAVQLVELDRSGFVARVALLLVVVDVDLDVGHERVVDGGSDRVNGRGVRGGERVEMDAVEVGGERVVHRLGPGGA